MNASPDPPTPQTGFSPSSRGQSGTALSEPSDAPAVLVETTDALESLLARCRDQTTGTPLRCALDTEADSLHCYREKLCLLQFACGEEIAIIDPLKVGDLRPLQEFLREAEIWMHGSDFDMLMLQRSFGEVPEAILDTQVAARLVGYRKFGLAAIIEAVFGVSLSKSSQRADWGKRPLTEKMVEYAANDVRFLLPLADILLARLGELGRTAWFYESCVAARVSFLARPERSEDDVWRINGWGKLHPRGLAFLRALWQWRDREAEALDRPAFKVLGNDLLLSFALALEADQNPSLPQRMRPDRRRRLIASIDGARKIPKDEWPRRRRPTGRGPAEENEPEFLRLRALRDKRAHALDLEPALVATRSALEAISVRPDAAADVLMDWQREVLFGDRPGDDDRA